MPEAPEEKSVNPETLGQGFPRLTVVIPVHNAREMLRNCLTHLFRSRPAQPDECIVVDDGSTDGSARIAEEFGCRVITSCARRGPAYARNLGAIAASGDVLFFLDADICVHPDTLKRVRESFRAEPGLDALMGSYDDEPEHQDFLSQYRNLMHCFVHQTSRREACTFWSGCGAIRRDVFLRHGGFDESYSRPAIEDIELGYRLQQAGCRLLLDRDIQVKHLKRWTFWNLFKTDVRDRGIPWTELILRDQQMPNDLNLHLSQRVSVVLVFLLLAVCATAAWIWGHAFLLPLFALLVLSLGTYWVEGVPTRIGAVVAAVLTAVISFYAWRNGMPFIVPPLAVALITLFLRHRYRMDGAPWRRRLNNALLGAAAAAGIWADLAYLPNHTVTVVALAILLTLIVLNNRFYIFLAAKRGRMFAIAAIPFHILHHFFNGLSFAAGLLIFTWKRAFSPARVATAGDHTDA